MSAFCSHLYWCHKHSIGIQFKSPKTTSFTLKEARRIIMEVESLLMLFRCGKLYIYIAKDSSHQPSCMEHVTESVSLSYPYQAWLARNDAEWVERFEEIKEGVSQLELRCEKKENVPCIWISCTLHTLHCSRIAAWRILQPLHIPFWSYHLGKHAIPLPQTSIIRRYAPMPHTLEWKERITYTHALT